MRKILWIAVLLGVTLFPSCEGPEGPQGPPGFDGQDGRDGKDGKDGDSFVNLVFEVEVDFTEENGYNVVFPFEIFEDDSFIVFLEWGVANGRSVWRPLPQTVFFEGGVLTYNYQFSSEFLSVFLEGNVDPEALGEEWTQNQLLRIIYMPGFFAGGGARMDFSDMDAVMKYLGLTEKDVKRITIK